MSEPQFEVLVGADPVTGQLPAPTEARMDTVVAGHVDNPDSDLRASLNATYVAQQPFVDTFMAASGTAHILHDGTSLAGPMATRQFMELASSVGLGHFDLNVRSFAGCTTDLAWWYLPTVDANSTSAGNVADHSPQSFRALTVDAGSWFNQGWGDCNPMTVVDVFDRYAGKGLFHIEIKDGTTSVTDPAPILLALIQRYRMERQVIVSAFQQSVLAPFIAAGIEVGWIATNDDLGSTTPSALLAAGIKFLYLKGKSWTNDPTSGDPADAASDATFTTFINAGVHVIPWTMGRQFEVARYTALGCKAVYVTSAYATGRTALYRRTTDPFVANRQANGPLLTNDMSGGAQDDTVSTDRRGIFGSGRHRSAVSGGANNQGIQQSWALPLATPTAVQIDVNFVFDVPHSNQGQGYSVDCCFATDAPFFAASTSQGYRFYFRQNGSCNAYKYTGSGSSVIATVTWTALLATPPVLSSGLTSGVAITSLPVTSLPASVVAGTKLLIQSTGGAGGKGQIATVSSTASAAATSIAITSITPNSTVASGSKLLQVVPLRLTISPTSVSLTRQDIADPAISTTDTAYRGAYFAFAKQGGGSGNMEFSYQDVVIT